MATEDNRPSRPCSGCPGTGRHLPFAEVSRWSSSWRAELRTSRTPGTGHGLHYSSMTCYSGSPMMIMNHSEYVSQTLSVVDTPEPAAFSKCEYDQTKKKTSCFLTGNWCTLYRIPITRVQAAQVINFYIIDVKAPVALNIKRIPTVTTKISTQRPKVRLASPASAFEAAAHNSCTPGTHVFLRPAGVTVSLHRANPPASVNGPPP